MAVGMRRLQSDLDSFKNSVRDRQASQDIQPVRHPCGRAEKELEAGRTTDFRECARKRVSPRMSRQYQVELTDRALKDLDRLRDLRECAVRDLIRNERRISGDPALGANIPARTFAQTDTDPFGESD